MNFSDRDYVSQLPDIPLEYLDVAFTGRARDTGRLVSSGSISASRPEMRELWEFSRWNKTPFQKREVLARVKNVENANTTLIIDAN